MTSEVKVALFWALRSDEPGGRGVQREELKRLVNSYNNEMPQHEGLTILGEYAVLLTLPENLPILSELTAAAQKYGHKYEVRLFGQPLLSFPAPG